MTTDVKLHNSCYSGLSYMYILSTTQNAHISIQTSDVPAVLCAIWIDVQKLRAWVEFANSKGMSQLCSILSLNLSQFFCCDIGLRKEQYSSFSVWQFNVTIVSHPEIRVCKL